jgi:hypothetical protein
MGQVGGALQNVGSAFGNAATFAPDPSGFSGSEWTARLLGGAGKGLMQGYGNMQQQNQQMRQGGGGAGPVQPAQPTNIQFASQNFTPGAAAGAPSAGQLGSDRMKRNPMFYGYGEGS